VNIGTVVHFAGDVEPLTILGSWDADVDRRIFANGSGLAEALLGKAPGEQAEIEGRTVTIASIEAWQG
jgi:transcription elongation GreA/GreB family factor